jgi:peptidoglycan/xylan/chitin deacetylase (PgdA/CDA1 family)
LKRAYQAGHQIGTFLGDFCPMADNTRFKFVLINVIPAMHTWSHADLTTLSENQIVAEIVWTARIIKDVIGVTPNYLRPPFGSVDSKGIFLQILATIIDSLIGK